MVLSKYSIVPRLLIGLLLLVAGPLQANSTDRTIDFGPLKTYAQSPQQLISLTPQLRSAFSLLPGEVEVFGTASIASVWADSRGYTADYYHNALVAGAFLQLDSNWALEMDFSWRFAANNSLDSLTSRFHKIFGVSQGGRIQSTKHQFDISHPDYGVEEHNFSGDTLQQAITLYSQYQLFENSHHGLNIGAALYYDHVPNGPFATDKFEQLLQVNYSYRFANHKLYTTVGASFRDCECDLVGIPYSEATMNGAAGYQYKLNNNHRILLEYKVFQGGEDEFTRLSDPSHEFSLGYRYHLSNGAIEITTIENVLYMNNSSDIAFVFGYRHRI